MMKIGIIGAGKLGLCFALLCENAGFKVIVSDIRDTYLDSIDGKTLKSWEPEVEELLSKATNLITSKSNLEIFEKCDLVWIFIETPSLPNGSYDVSRIEKVIEQYPEKSRKSQKIIIGSTVNPGDCDRLSLKLGNRATLIYNPEFIAQGTIIRDLRQAEIVLVGVDIDGNEASPVQQLEEVYNRIQGLDSNLRVMSRKAAEITKIAINSFLTNKIAFANIVGDILVSSGQEEFIEEVLDTIGEDSRIGKKYLKYGFGFGGPCLPRDNRAFANFSKILNINYEIGIVVDAMNSQHAGFLLELHERKNINNLPYFFDSIAYKLGTDILVESQQYRLFVDLLNRGRRVFLRADSRIELQIKSQLEKKHLELIRLVQSIEEVDCEVFPVLFN